MARFRAASQKLTAERGAPGRSFDVVSARYAAIHASATLPVQGRARRRERAGAYDTWLAGVFRLPAQIAAPRSLNGLGAPFVSSFELTRLARGRTTELSRTKGVQSPFEDQ